MRVEDAMMWKGYRFSREVFGALEIPDHFYDEAVRAFERANATPQNVRRFHDTAHGCDTFFVTGVGKNGEHYDWGDKIKERA